MQFFTKYIRFPAAASKQEKLIATAGSNKRGLVHIFTDLTKMIYIEIKVSKEKCRLDVSSTEETREQNMP